MSAQPTSLSKCNPQLVKRSCKQRYTNDTEYSCYVTRDLNSNQSIASITKHQYSGESNPISTRC